MSTGGVPKQIEEVDVRITGALARLGVPVVRIALGIVFLWFGVLKFSCTRGAGWSSCARPGHRTACSLANTEALPPDQRDAIRGTTAISLFGL